MYNITITNGTITTPIQNDVQKVLSGTVVQGINTIDSFTFSILPNNPAFNNLHDFKTFVNVYNTKKQRYEFRGRVLYSTPSMSESGLITQEATCESFLGFLCDSQQEYVAEKTWTVEEFLTHTINCHNSQLEEYKHFSVVIADDLKTKTVYCGIQRKNTLETIREKLLADVGGEIDFGVVGGQLVLYYAMGFGETKTTEIAVSRNMKSITKEKDPSSFITRLIPLGAKLNSNTEERIDITSVNDGKNYIDDTQAIEEYGLHVGYVEFDDVTLPENLLTKAQAWLKNNNKVLVKYSITALDLSLIDLDIDDFQVKNYYPIKNHLLEIDDTARIIKKTIDVCEDAKSAFEIGESFKTLSEIQREQITSIGKVTQKVNKIQGDYVTTTVLNATKAEILENTVGVKDTVKVVEMVNSVENGVAIKSDSFTLSKEGIIDAKAGKIGSWSIFGGNLVGNYLNETGSLIDITPDYVRALVGQDETTAIQKSWYEIMSAILFIQNNRQEIIALLGKSE